MLTMLNHSLVLEKMLIKTIKPIVYSLTKNYSLMSWAITGCNI